MNHVQEMVKTHPHRQEAGRIDMDALTACIQECFDCSQTCTACADACLGEEDISQLTRCIRLNLDCADICLITGQVLSRQTEPDWNLLRMQVEACMTVCRTCGEECRRHAGHHEHCRVCAESCRSCEDACNRVLELSNV